MTANFALTLVDKLYFLIIIINPVMRKAQRNLICSLER